MHHVIYLQSNIIFKSHLYKTDLRRSVSFSEYNDNDDDDDDVND
jgi:hypothetical protein